MGILTFYRDINMRMMNYGYIFGYLYHIKILSIYYQGQLWISMVKHTPAPSTMPWQPISNWRKKKIKKV